MERFRPQVLLVDGVCPVAAALLQRARDRGTATVLRVSDCTARDGRPFVAADAVIVPSQFTADFYQECFGRPCVVLPDVLEPAAAAAGAGEPRYVLFPDPTPVGGLLAFARIAELLGRLRPDIPLLAAGPGAKVALDRCAIDLRVRGNVHLLQPAAAPGTPWGLARVALLLALGWERPATATVEALRRGIPAVASDRGSTPELLGGAGVVLPLPDRLTPAAPFLPTAEEVVPWIEALVRLWDDAASYAEQRQRTEEAARRYSAEVVGPRWLKLIEHVAASRGAPAAGADAHEPADAMGETETSPPGRGRTRERPGEGDRPATVHGRSSPMPHVLEALPHPPAARATSPGGRGFESAATEHTAVPPGRARAVVLVPCFGAIEPECEEGLRALEREGLRVVRRPGSSGIDVARNEMASDALHDGCEALLFIDADLGFDPRDALRLLARPEPVVSGVYPKKRRREMASTFADGIAAVGFGPRLGGTYPLKYAATGFLRVRADVLRTLIERLDLPLCNRKWGRGVWPFFQPLVVPHPECEWHYLGEDWAFSHRLAQIGVTPLADTTVRLWHFGSYGFGWEDAGADPARHRDYTFRI